MGVVGESLLPGEFVCPGPGRYPLKLSCSIWLDLTSPTQKVAVLKFAQQTVHCSSSKGGHCSSPSPLSATCTHAADQPCRTGTGVDRSKDRAQIQIDGQDLGSTPMCLMHFFSSHITYQGHHAATTWRSGTLALFDATASLQDGRVFVRSSAPPHAGSSRFGVGTPST